MTGGRFLSLLIGIAMALVVIGCASPPEPASTPDPDIEVGGVAYAVCTDQCREHGVCERRTERETGWPLDVIYLRPELGRASYTLRRSLLPGWEVTILDVRNNWQAGPSDRLATDAFYLVHSEEWDEGESYWVPVFCLTAHR